MNKRTITIIISLLLSFGGVGVAHALTAVPPRVPADSASTSTSNQQARLANIKSKGDAEINRRIKTLNEFASKLSAAAKLSSADKTSLSAEVNSEISGLTALKTKLDAETTLDGAIADAKSIISDYRVYALVAPKVMLVKTADDEIVVQTKLTALAAKLQSRISSAQSSGKNVTSLQANLSDMNTQINAASAISTSVESKVIVLQPTDYNSDHSVLNGYRDQLQTARTDDQNAINDAKTIVNGLKGL